MNLYNSNGGSLPYVLNDPQLSNGRTTNYLPTAIKIKHNRYTRNKNTNARNPFCSLSHDLEVAIYISVPINYRDNYNGPESV